MDPIAILITALALGARNGVRDTATARLRTVEG